MLAAMWLNVDFVKILSEKEMGKRDKDGKAAIHHAMYGPFESYDIRWNHF